LAFSGSCSRAHGLLGSLSWVFSWVVAFAGQSASRTLSNQAPGRLILAMRELTLPERGDLASRPDQCSFGVAAVTAVALLVGLSLVIKEQVVMPMVAIGRGVEWTLKSVMMSPRMQIMAAIKWRCLTPRIMGLRGGA
jgi:hypothetical protein